ncbi:MAG TPA: His/Gly/Thr/Pro-type tRNA ligase C-terminal domain-containing protein, partial [Pirellulales bacterium]|nr:His/Gly/Thr/Pro-type tRNA ligase C-terminal domain-containing protein [Pirellulales bacterium]
KYADRRGFKVAVIAGEDELAAGNCQIKNLASGESVTVPLAGDLAGEIGKLLRPTVQE